MNKDFIGLAVEIYRHNEFDRDSGFREAGVDESFIEINDEGFLIFIDFALRGQQLFYVAGILDVQETTAIERRPTGRRS